MSDLPRPAGCAPVAVKLTAGVKYAWCSCGLSATQPFCDGTHRGTDFKPVKWVAPADEEVWLCLCKRTGTQPRCDGTHESLPTLGG